MYKWKKMLPYLAILAADFYLLPALIRNTGSAMIMMLAVIPLVCFACSLVYGIRNSFCIWYCVAAAAMFAPSIFIYYNAGAWFYAIIYGIVALLGNLTGAALHKIAG